MRPGSVARRGRVVAAALLLGGALGGAQARPAHAAGWLAPFGVAGPPAVAPSVALDGAGDAFLAWGDGSSGTFARTRPAGGALTAARPLGTQAIEPPVVAADPKGAAITAWVAQGDDIDDPPRIEFARGGPAGFGAVETLAGTGASTEALVAAVDGSGAALLAWNFDTGGVTRVRTAVIPPGRAPVVSLVSDAAGDASDPQVATNAAGAALVAWVQSTEDNQDAQTTTTTRLQLSRRAAPGTAVPVGTTVGAPAVSTATDLGDGANTSGQELAAASVAADDAGGALLAVQRSTISPGSPTNPNDDSRTAEVDVTTGSVGAGVGPVVRLSPPGQNAGEPVIAANPGGQSVVAWPANDGATLQAASRPPGGAFGDLETLAGSPAGQRIIEPSAAVRAGGEEVVTWITALLNTGPVSAAQRSPGGDFAGSGVSAPDARAKSPVVAADRQGNALDVWQLDLDPNTPDDTVQGAAFDGAGPTVTTLTVPRGAAAGAEIALSVAAVDTWSPFTVRWDFGDGTTADGTTVRHAYAKPGGYMVVATLTDAAGNVTTGEPRTVTVSADDRAVAPAPPASSGGSTPAPAPDGAPPGDTTPPVLGGVKVVRSIFRVGGQPGPFAPAIEGRAAALQRGSALRFTLSERARVQITVSRLISRRGGLSRCIRLGAPPRGHATTIGRVGILVIDQGAGTRTIPISGRVGRRALRRGRYALRLQPIDPAGNIGRVAEARATVC